MEQEIRASTIFTFIQRSTST